MTNFKIELKSAEDGGGYRIALHESSGVAKGDESLMCFYRTQVLFRRLNISAPANCSPRSR